MSHFLQGCFRAAILSGFTGIQILNHVDDALHTTWRNLIDFDPLVQYGGYSYEDVVVRPAADALRTVTRPSTKVRGGVRVPHLGGVEVLLCLFAALSDSPAADALRTVTRH
jgi:hypothetical protein